MTNPPQEGRPAGEPGRPQQPWPPQGGSPQQPWPPQGGSPQPGPWGPPAPGPYGPPSGQPPYGQPPAGQGWGGQPAPGRPPYWTAQPQYGQPQYGQPQYGPPVPYGPPPHGWQYGPRPDGQRPRRSWRRTVLGLAALAALLVLAVVLARLLGDTVLDRGAVESDVAEQFEERYGVEVDLDCPAEMTVEADAVYRCTGTTEDGEDVNLEIRITDVIRAAYTWQEV